MKTIRLRALEPEDIDRLYRWENDPAVWSSGVDHVPFSRHVLTEYIMQAASADLYASRQLRLIGCDGDNGAAVSCVDLYDYDPYNHRAAVGLLVDAAQRNQGYGRATLRSLADYCRDHLQLHQLYATIALDNHACRCAFEYAGFEQCGLFDEWQWSPQGWKDCVMLALLLTDNPS